MEVETLCQTKITTLLVSFLPKLQGPKNKDCIYISIIITAICVPLTQCHEHSK